MRSEPSPARRLTACFAVGTGIAKLNRKRPTTQALSIRLTATERQTLEQAAGTMPLSAYARRHLLDVQPRASFTRRPGIDAQTHGRLLAVLGRTRLASSLADLSEAARLGTVALSPEHLVWIKAAHDNLRDIRTLLTQALGASSGERL